MATKSRLGKGLGALFPDLPGEQSAKTTKPSVVAARPVTGNTPAGETQSKKTQQQPAADVVRDGSPASGAKAETAERQRHQNTHAGSGKAKGKRASMPALDDIAHPSDLFFGDLTENLSGNVSATSLDSAPRSGKAHGSVSHETKTEEKPKLKPVLGGYLDELNISDIGPNEHQPRTIFDEDELNELAASITEVGVLQPIVVRKRPVKSVGAAPTSGEASAHDAGKDASSNTPYELIMGERRWRASQLAGLSTIPAIVKTTADDDMLRDALLENLHRVALNPLEEAAAYQQMIDEFGLTQAELSKSVSKSRPQIANTLRLLNLPAVVQKKVAAGILSAGHARALLALTDESEMDKLAARIIAEGLSVRSTEEIVSMKIAQGEQPRNARANRNNPWANSPIQQNLENRFDTKVTIKGSQKHGRIEIVFSSPEDMDRILSLLMHSTTTAPAPEGEWK